MKTKSIALTDIESPNPNGLPRRDFFKLLGGGIFVFFTAWDPDELMKLQPQTRRELPTDYKAFLHVDEDGMVSGFTGKIEMGQGPITSLAQMLADEMDLSYDHVSMVMGDTDICPWDMGTFGSMTTRFFGPPFRAAAAEARGILLQLGSEQLGVPVSQLEVKEGVIYDRNNPDHKVTYGQLTKGKKIERFMDKKPPLKEYKDFKIVGRSHLRKDSHLKVTGGARYSGDFHPEGMLYARILRPPSHGAKFVSADTSAAEKIDGVKVVKNGDFVAVLHELKDIADEAIVKVKG